MSADAVPIRVEAALRAGAQRSPVLPGQMYEGIASRTVMAHCLDQRNALSLAGWPTEDVLYSLRRYADAVGCELRVTLAPKPAPRKHATARTDTQRAAR